MSSLGGQIFTAIRTRLETIQTSNGYLNDVKKVVTGRARMTLDMPEPDLPYIEVLKDSDNYDHNAGSSYWEDRVLVIFMVAPREWEDVQMEDLMQDVRQCLFGGSANATGNTGMTLSGLVQSMHLIDSHSDLGLIESNRIFSMRIRLRSHRTTYRD